MELPALIIWNATLYGLYYGLNLVADYMRRPRLTDTGSRMYRMADLFPGTLVRISDFPDVIAQTDRVSGGSADHIRFTTPVEDQGIPLPDFISRSRDFCSGMAF